MKFCTANLIHRAKWSYIGRLPNFTLSSNFMHIACIPKDLEAILDVTHVILFSKEIMASSIWATADVFPKKYNDEGVDKERSFIWVLLVARNKISRNLTRIVKIIWEIELWVWYECQFKISLVIMRTQTRLYAYVEWVSFHFSLILIMVNLNILKCVEP